MAREIVLHAYNHLFVITHFANTNEWRLKEIDAQGFSTHALHQMFPDDDSAWAWLRSRVGELAEGDLKARSLID